MKLKFASTVIAVICLVILGIPANAAAAENCTTNSYITAVPFTYENFLSVGHRADKPLALDAGNNGTENNISYNGNTELPENSLSNESSSPNLDSVQSP